MSAFYLCFFIMIDSRASTNFVLLTAINTPHKAIGATAVFT